MNTTKNWSKYQTAIFAFIQNATGNAVVEAVAGSGKSTTIVEGMNRIPAGKTAIFLAFNKAIAEELKARGVNARTFHSLTYNPVTKAANARNIETAKLQLIVKEKLSGNDAFLYGSFITRMVGLGRQAGIGCLVADTQQAWVDLVEYHSIDLDNENAEFGRAIDLCSQLLNWSNADARIDFDDLLYLAVKNGLSLPKFDFVFVDEAQDTNAIQRALLRKILHAESRLIAVGDPAQAIYGFRGADSNSLDLIAEEFNCARLPLTVSYRCPTSVVEYAHRWVSHIEAAPNAAAGEVIEMGQKWTTDDFVNDDLIVCRTTKPLISLAYKFLRARIPAKIMGREIGQGLKTLINKLNAKGIDNLITKLEMWESRESEKAIAKKQDNKVEAIQDKAYAVLCLIDGMTETGRTIPVLLAIIDSLFSDSKGSITLATIHKAKGLEANRVFWLNSSQCPAKWAKTEWQQQQENNLCYVAVTRAKQALVLIEEQKRSAA
jgi:DNA helicase II / ATP-dependent DNA helicase PcrA